jgi:hypothetical protein
MSLPCLLVRDRLAEYALDVLDATDAHEIERHLDACPGCRKEAEDFREGAARIALELPQHEPGPALEERVVTAVAEARDEGAEGARTRRGRDRSFRSSSRRSLKLVAAAALAAAVMAGGSLSWALAMRGQVAVKQKALEQNTQTVRRLDQFIAEIQRELTRFQHIDNAEKGKVFGALMSSPGPDGGSGQLLVVSVPGRTPDFVHLQANLPPSARGPFKVLFDQAHGDSIKAGGLTKTPNGDFVLAPKDPQFFDVDLSKLTSVIVLDHQGETLLTGAVQLITQPAS